jgi:hypothetical protein
LEPEVLLAFSEMITCLFLLELLGWLFKVEIDAEDIDTLSLFDKTGVSAKHGVTIEVEIKVTTRVRNV